MGHIVIKPSPGRDEYVLWSTVVDVPVGHGNRAEMAAVLADDHACSGAPADPSEARLERTDRNGSSMVAYSLGYWDDLEFIYEQRGLLPREHLYRAAVLLGEGRESEVWDLLVPFEGETEVRRG